MPIDPALDTFAKRLAWVLANRRQKDGAAWDQKALSLAAGLSTSHVGQYVRGEQTNPTLDVLRRLGRAAGVSAAWLGFGTGTADSTDGEELTYSDSAVPIARNVPGWSQVLQLDQMAAANSDAGQLITPDAWERSNHAARYLIHGPAAPGDALRIAKLAMEVADPGRFERAYAATMQRIEENRPENERLERETMAAIAAKERGEKPPKVRKAKAAK